MPRRRWTYESPLANAERLAHGLLRRFTLAERVAFCRRRNRRVLITVPMERSDTNELRGYMTDPTWAQTHLEVVGGRPLRVFTKRPRRIVDLLHLAAASPELDLLVRGDQRVVFDDFVRATASAAEAFAARGVGPGDRVMVVLYNSCEFLLAQWATWRLGAVPVLGNRWWSSREMATAMSVIRPTLVITDAAFDDSVLAGIPVVHPDELAGCWTTSAPADVVDPRPSEDDIALILFTAGSTGEPKGVQLSHRALVATQQTLHAMRGQRPATPSSPEAQSVALMTTPMFHLGGVTAGISALLDGNRIVMLRGRFDPLEVLAVIQHERVTSWNAVPTVYQRVMEHPRFEEFDLSSFAAPSTGGTMVPPRLLVRAREKFPAALTGISVGWGMTEAAFLTIANGTEIATRPGTVGRAIPNVELAIDEPDDDGEGELLARSATLMLGYLDSMLQPITADGWFHTGDVGHIDHEGYAYITGRMKDIVIRGGENIACPHVQDVLAEHPGVAEIVVFAVPHPDYGEELAAVVSRRDASATVAGLTAFGRERLAHFEVPTRWLLIDEQLPTLPTGKVDKVSLRSRLIDADSEMAS